MSRGVGWQACLGVDWMEAVGPAACQGRVTAAAAPSLLIPSSLEVSSLRLTKPKPRCRIKGSNTCFEEGPWDGSRYGCVGFVF